MNKPREIRYLKRSGIDDRKWDDCIRQADNGLIYGFSFYLDQMARQWDALVLNDYEAVMPLPWNRKFGISYIYQPAFCASLGIFGKGITQQLAADFIDQIPATFRLVEISLNHDNPVNSTYTSPRVNYILSLNQPYEALRQAYRENTRRNIKKAEQLGCTYKKDIPLKPVISLSKQLMQKVSHTGKEDYTRFEKLYHYLVGEKMASSHGIYSPADELLSSCVYFYSHGRAYYILVGNHPIGRTLGASHYLIDRFIYERSNQQLILDFEGSDLPNLAHFYGSFGASTETYSFLKINRLPWWARWKK
jgi:hypothetical protein